LAEMHKVARNAIGLRLEQRIVEHSAPLGGAGEQGNAARPQRIQAASPFNLRLIDYQGNGQGAT